MNDLPGPAVALLFDDTELGGHLREALQERGARIVHEGGVAGFDQALLDHVNADVLVINLDDTVDDSLDAVYDLVGAERPRVVFNDAQASRALDGWDRARWARHLAVKVMAEGDLDPPRPDAARGLDVAGAATEAARPTTSAGAETESTAVSHEEGAQAAVPVDAQAYAGDDQQKQLASAESETLAAELEALLASDGSADDASGADAYGFGESWGDGDEESSIEPDEGSRGTAGQAPEFTGDEAFGDALTSELTDADEESESRRSATAPEQLAEGLDALLAPNRKETDALSANIVGAQADALSLAPHAEGPLAPMASTQDHPPAAAAPVSAPAEWALLDDAALQRHAESGALGFGVEKLSASEFLAPEAESDGEDTQPTMSLELVSLEEAVAPQAYQPDHEMVLDDTGTALSRIVLLGAASTACESVADFLAALPDTTRLTFLLVQHLDSGSAPALLKHLAAKSSLPVRMAEDYEVARPGEVLVAPPDARTTLHRNGRIAVTTIAGFGTPQSHAIDASLTMVAGTFGRDALAVVFAGNGTDAVGGCQAVHDRGGRVWVESAPGDYASDMVSGIFVEQLVDFSGSSQELAAHLTEVYS